MAAFLKKALRMEGPQLQQRLITIKKNARESLGMRIGGGIGSNEGDTPIYIANIHPHGCIGKSKQMKASSCLRPRMHSNFKQASLQLSTRPVKRSEAIWNKLRAFHLIISFSDAFLPQNRYFFPGN